MSSWSYHWVWGLALAFGLILLIINLEFGADYKTLLTCLAPTLWLGLYWLGSDHAADKAE